MYTGDFLVIMVISVLMKVLGRWIFGQMLCDMWTSLDVMLCTASILNLCMISIDRYFVITKPFEYAVKRTPARMALMILSVWILSALISIPPLFGSWKAEYKEGHCEVSQDIGYQFYATIGAFYLPLAVMIFIYYRIYVVSSRISRAESKSKPVERDSKSSSSLGGRRKISAESGPNDTSSMGGAPAGGSRISFAVDKTVQYGRSGISSMENSEDTNSSSSKVSLFVTINS